MPGKKLSPAEKRMGHSFNSKAHQKMQRSMPGKMKRAMSERLGVKRPTKPSGY